MQKYIILDTSGFVLKTKLTDKSDLKKRISDVHKKISDTSELIKKTNYNAKISEIESKIPSISGLATNSALTPVENKVPDVSNLVKKTSYDAKVMDIENKYITTVDYKTFTKDVVANKIKSEELTDKSIISGFIKLYW